MMDVAYQLPSSVTRKRVLGDMRGTHLRATA
jgi:hypothetical protein